MWVRFKHYRIKAKLVCKKPALWDRTNYNHHRVTVKNTYVQRQATFDFWIDKDTDNWRSVNIENSRRKILSAVLCWILDALAAKLSLEEFSDKYKYYNPFAAHVAYSKCKKSLKQVTHVIASDTELLGGIAERLLEEIRREKL